MHINNKQSTTHDTSVAEEKDAVEAAIPSTPTKKKIVECHAGHLPLYCRNSLLPPMIQFGQKV